MNPRPKTALAGMKIRLREPLRARLESTAKRNGVSLNKELVARLEQSFSKDDAYGGADVRRVSMLMTAAFAIDGTRKAEEKGLDRWTNDQDCYVAGALSVVSALMRHAPRPLSKLEAEAFVSRIYTEFANMKGNADGTR